MSKAFYKEDIETGFFVPPPTLPTEAFKYLVTSAGRQAMINQGRSDIAQMCELFKGSVYEKVSFGAEILLRNDDGEKVVRIVSAVEVPYVEHSVSVQSPIAQALIGQRVGDFVEIRTPKSVDEYEIVAINPIGIE